MKQEIEHIALKTKALNLKDVEGWKDKMFSLVKGLYKSIKSLSFKEALKELLKNK